MPKTLRYVGGHADVFVPLPDGSADVYVARGKTAVFPDDVADSLLEQESNWKAVKPATAAPAAKRTTKRTPKPAAATTAAASSPSPAKES
jgi:hypothetical protein